jgi:hypothetical protein
LWGFFHFTEWMLYEPKQFGCSDEEMWEDFMSDGARLNQQLEWRNQILPKARGFSRQIHRALRQPGRDIASPR